MAPASGTRPGPLLRAAIVAFSAGLIALGVVANVTGLQPLRGARLAARWKMFSSPPQPEVTVIEAVPRPGDARTEPYVLVDPIDTDRPLVDRIRDARHRRLHDNLALTPALRDSYLAHLCARHGGDVLTVRILVRSSVGRPDVITASRDCAPSHRDP